MTERKVTLYEAYMIENLKKQGISNSELINIDDQAIERWNKLDLDFDFNILKELAEKNEEVFAEIISEGYNVKFLTLKGLINLIQLKFDKQLDVNFTVHEDSISHLQLDKSRYPEMKQFLSPNWKVLEEDNLVSTRAVHSSLLLF